MSDNSTRLAVLLEKTGGLAVERLTMRDVFALAVVGSIWECMDSGLDSGSCAVNSAQKAYMVADAMLIERKQ